jgi:hypothetical protein
MFTNIQISFDYKELEVLKTALENEIENLERQNFAGIENEIISENKQTLKKITNAISKILTVGELQQ